MLSIALSSFLRFLFFQPLIHPAHAARGNQAFTLFYFHLVKVDSQPMFYTGACPFLQFYFRFSSERRRRFAVLFFRHLFTGDLPEPEFFIANPPLERHTL